MKKVKLKNKKRKRKVLLFFFIGIFIYSIYITFNYLDNKNISYDNKTIATILLKSSNKSLKVKKENILNNIIKTISNPINIVSSNYF